MTTRPFAWMTLKQDQGLSHDDQMEFRAELELADVPGIGLRKQWIIIHTTASTPLPHPQQEAELEVLTRARDALDRQIAAIQQSP
jgi:hypothetical protein